MVRCSSRQGTKLSGSLFPEGQPSLEIHEVRKGALQGPALPTTLPSTGGVDYRCGFDSHAHARTAGK